MLNALLPQPDEESKEKGGPAAGLGLGTATLECYFLTALYWSLGACLIEESRVKFDAYVKKLANLTEVPGEGNVAGPGEIPVHHSTLYEYFYDGDEGKWVPWVMKVPEYVHNSSLPYNEILVPTVDTVCNTWLLELMVKIKRPVVLVGETGTSKTATIQNFLRELDPETTVSTHKAHCMSQKSQCQYPNLNSYPSLTFLTHPYLSSIYSTQNILDSYYVIISCSSIML